MKLTRSTAPILMAILVATVLGVATACQALVRFYFGPDPVIDPLVFGAVLLLGTIGLLVFAVRRSNSNPDIAP